MRKFALLCPGQGGQHPDMFALAETNEHAAILLAQLDTNGCFGLALKHLLNTPDQLFDNQFAQPLIVAASLLNWVALCAQSGMDGITPVLVAGYSVGELAAHAISGEMNVEQAVSLARMRGLAMQSCVASGLSQAMLAVSGIHIDRLQQFCLIHRLYIAIVTAENNAIVAGLRTDVVAAESILRQQTTGQLHLSMLPVHIASHTPLMLDATPVFARALEGIFNQQTKPIITPVVAGVNALKVRDSYGSKQSLLAQMTQTIRWHECMDAYHEAGIEVVLELGPGSALSRMLQARHPHIACRSVADFRSWSAVAEWVTRQVFSD